MGLASSSDVLLGERVPCFTALRQEYLLSACMLTRSMFFWKSPVSMFLKGFLEITHFQSRKHGTDGTLADQKQFDVSLRLQPIFFPKLVCD